MTIPAFALIAPTSLGPSGPFDAGVVVWQLPDPRFVGQSEYYAIHELVVGHANACDGRDRIEVLGLLISICGSFVSLATNLAAQLEAIRRVADPLDPEDEDAEVDDMGFVITMPLRLSDYEMEEREQWLLPFAGVAEHYAAQHAETMRIRRLEQPTPSCLCGAPAGQVYEKTTVAPSPVSLDAVASATA